MIMPLFKKKYFYHLYIFFLVLILFFSEFSTNIASSKNYNILDIRVEENYDINFDKSKVINKAFEEAFEVLIYKLIERYTYTKENSDTKVIHLKVVNGGHLWLGSPIGDWLFLKLFFGKNNHEINSSKELVDFFLKYKLSDFN